MFLTVFIPFTIETLGFKAYLRPSTCPEIFFATVFAYPPYDFLDF